MHRSAGRKIEIQCSLRDDPVRCINRLAEFTIKRIVQSDIRLCDPDLFARGVHADAAESVEPVRAGGESPGIPGCCVIEFGDELRQAVTGGIDLRAQVGDFPFERVGTGQ